MHAKLHIFLCPSYYFFINLPMKTYYIRSIITSKSELQYVTQTKQYIPFMLYFGCRSLPFLPFYH